MARVVIENLTKVFKGPRGATIRAVNQASLTIEDGEFLVLVGPSGCGKTTTLRLIAGLEDITEGTIAIDGRVVNRVEPKDRDIAMVFQNYALYPHMTVFENLAFGLKLRKTARAEIDKRVREAAELLDLCGCLDRKPGELSGGQRQRVAVGRAIVRKPALFLFDEPLSNLDAPLRAQMRREISRLHKRLATPVLYVTHDQSEAMTLGDRMAVMKDGVIQQVDKPVNVYQRPANLFVAGFIGSPPMNFFHGTIVQRDGNVFFQEQAAPAGAAAPVPAFAVRLDAETAAQVAGYQDKRIVLGIRPEHISMERDAAVSGTTVEALVETVEFLGAESHLHAKTAAHSLIARISSFSSTEAIRKTALVFDMRHARFFDPETQKAVA